MALTAGCGGEDTAASGSGSDTNADGKRVITVAHTNYYVPYDFVNDQGESDGFEVAVMKEVAKKLPQYEFKFVPTSDDDLLIGVESGKVSIGIATFVMLQFLTLVIEFDVTDGTIVLYLAVGLQHVLVLATKFLMNLCSRHLVVQILCCFQIRGIDICKLGIEHIDHKVRRCQYREIDNGWKDVLRLLEINLVCNLHVSAVLSGVYSEEDAPGAEWL